MINDLRKKTVDELKKIEEESRAELFALRFQSSVGNLEKPHRINELKKTVARILTVINEKLSLGETLTVKNVKVDLAKALEKAEKATKTFKKEQAESETNSTSEQQQSVAPSVPILEDAQKDVKPVITTKPVKEKSLEQTQTSSITKEKPQIKKVDKEPIKVEENKTVVEQAEVKKEVKIVEEPKIVKVDQPIKTKPSSTSAKSEEKQEPKIVVDEPVKVEEIKIVVKHEDSKKEAQIVKETKTVKFEQPTKAKSSSVSTKQEPKPVVKSTASSVKPSKTIVSETKSKPVLSTVENADAKKTVNKPTVKEANSSSSKKASVNASKKDDEPFEEGKIISKKTETNSIKKDVDLKKSKSEVNELRQQPLNFVEQSLTAIHENVINKIADEIDSKVKPKVEKTQQPEVVREMVEVKSITDAKATFDAKEIDKIAKESFKDKKKTQETALDRLEKVKNQSKVKEAAKIEKIQQPEVVREIVEVKSITDAKATFDAKEIDKIAKGNSKTKKKVQENALDRLERIKNKTAQTFAPADGKGTLEDIKLDVKAKPKNAKAYTYGKQWHANSESIKEISQKRIGKTLGKKKGVK